MAEFLLSNRDNSAAGGCAVGDIRDVRPDGWNWSAAELPNVVKLPRVEYDRKNKLPMTREFVMPVINRAGRLYDLDKMESSEKAVRDQAEIDEPNSIGVFEGGVETHDLVGGRELVGDIADDTPAKTVELRAGSVRLDTIVDVDEVAKRRWRINNRKLEDKVNV